MLLSWTSELFINGGDVYGRSEHRTFGISGFVSRETRPMAYDQFDQGEFLDLFHDDNASYLTEIFQDKIVAPYLFQCGKILWCGGHCTGTHTIVTLCVDCAEKKNILSKTELDEILRLAEVFHKREAELRIKYGP